MSDGERGRPRKAEHPTRSAAGHSTDSPDADLPRPGRLGDFELLREVGRGGMGIVYEARQISLKRRVALKVLAPGLGLTEQSVNRFEREAQAAAGLHHTNIVPVYATGEAEGLHYYAMEFVEGQSLSEILKDLGGARPNALLETTVTRLARDGPEDRTDEPPATTEPTGVSDPHTGSRRWFEAVAKLLADVGDALHYAHDRGVIHRDIKPANLLLSGDGRQCIGDFGLARVAQEPGITVSGSFLGTPPYMSPEQVATGAGKLDRRTDVYSLGAVLYEMLTLQRPFAGDRREQIFHAILSEDPVPPRRINPRVPLDLETICLKALEKDPARRYPTAGALAADLRRYLGHGLIAARRAGPIRRAGKFLRRHPLASVTTAGLMVVTLLALFAWRALEQRSHEAALRAFADARYYFSQGEYEPGLERVEAALARSPDLAEANLLRARLLMKLRRYDDAVSEARRMVEAEPDDWTGHLILALAANAPDSAFRMADIPGQEHLAQVERLAPETADAYHLRALAADDATQALTLLDRALAIDPSHAEATYERSRRHAERRNFEAALRDADRLVAVRPRSAQGHRIAGRLYAQQHDADRALEKFTQALRIEPDDPITLNERAQLYHGLGRYEEAFADLDRAIEIDPDYPRSHHERAVLYRSLERLDDTIENARRALELKQDYWDARWLLFNTLWTLGRTREMAELMQRYDEHFAGQQDTLQPEVRANRHIAWAYLRIAEQDPDAASALANRGVEAAPEWWMAYAQRSSFRRLSGDPRGAGEDCARAAGLPLSSLDELMKRALELTFRCGSTAPAHADYTRIIGAAPSWADPYLRRGEILQMDGRFDEALADLDRALELAPAWGEAFLSRGRLHSRQEHFEQALADLDRAAELGLGIADTSGSANLEMLTRRVDARLRLGRVDDALALLDAALLGRAGWIGAHLHRVISLERLGRLAQALAAADAGIAASRSRTENPFDVAQLHVLRAALRAGEARDCDGARADLEQAERMAEDAVWGPYLLALAARVHVITLRDACPALYNGPLALERIRNGLARNPGNAYLQGTLAASLYRGGEFAEALEILRRLDERQEFDAPRDLFYLAMTEWKLGRRTQARQAHARAVARAEATFPAEPESSKLRQESAALLGADPPR